MLPLITLPFQWRVWHKEMIVSADPTLGGDLVCKQLKDNYPFWIQVAIVSLWSSTFVAMCINFFVVRKRNGRLIYGTQ